MIQGKPSVFYGVLSSGLFIGVECRGNGLIPERMHPRNSVAISVGNDGRIASEVSGVETYYTRDAWTWELMALTRARVVCAPQGLKERLEALFHGALARPRDAGQLASDIAAMRRRVAAERGTDDPWAIKYAGGGLFDVEFIAQYLQLRDAATHPRELEPSIARRAASTTSFVSPL